MKFTSSLKLKLIYIFRINDDDHRGCLKIGEATSDNENIWGLELNSKALNKAAKKRIDQYTQTAGIAKSATTLKLDRFLIIRNWLARHNPHSPYLPHLPHPGFASVATANHKS